MSPDRHDNPDKTTGAFMSRHRLKQFIWEEMTFFRLHLLSFTFIPLVSSGVFFACNGRFPVSYLDSLFLCYSAMTVTGLSTINLSTITAFQQVILFGLMTIGDITFVSWLMVLVRKNYFKNECEYAVSKQPTLLQRSRTLIEDLKDRRISPPSNQRKANQYVDSEDDTPGKIEGEQNTTTFRSRVINPTPHPTPKPTKQFNEFLDSEHLDAQSTEGSTTDDAITDVNAFSSSPAHDSISLPPVSPVQSPSSPRPSGVEFAVSTSITPSAYRNRLNTIREGVPMPHKTMTMLTSRTNAGSTTHPEKRRQTKYTGLGGFPGPVAIADGLLQRAAPSFRKKIERKLTLPYTQTLNGSTINGQGEDTSPHNTSQKHSGWLKEKEVSWLDFAGLIVGRNSDFQTQELSDEQLENIGGVEYKALRLLSYLVPIYFIGMQLIAYLLFAPWLSSTSKYDHIFSAQPREVKKPWFALFQVMGAYTGGGLSLVDLGMVPFVDAYLMVFALAFVILAGNHALPIFLRLIIWILSHSVSKSSDSYKTLSFLLDHPRRCFIYLFPSHQTWFLVICLVAFSALEWIMFEVLNIGLEAYNSLPLGPRIVAGLFQGLAARASGFSIVALANFAPAVQFLYLVMMYIAIYPIALSIRSTNVYEERSLGVFEEPPDDEDDEPHHDLQNLSRGQRINKYVGWHLRRQLSVDIWWLVWAVFFIAIIERGNIMDQEKKWFDMFRVLFELVSAFGGIGLSLGFPSDNYAFVGAMKPLSKLIVVVIMVRGRHRGLPVAVDRAVLLPSELKTNNTADHSHEKTGAHGEFA